MRTRQIIALTATIAIAAGTGQMPVQAGQSNASLSGTAKDEAKKPYADYTVRARDVQQGTIASSASLDAEAKFALGSLQPARYLVELVNKDGKVVCTEGPFTLTPQSLTRDNININCNKVPVAWWLLGAAAAAGITAGVVAAGPASAAQ